MRRSHPFGRAISDVWRLAGAAARCVRRCCWLLSFLSANLFFFSCHFDLIDRDDARLLFFL
jgi:hypothetical protein